MSARPGVLVGLALSAALIAAGLSLTGTPEDVWGLWQLILPMCVADALLALTRSRPRAVRLLASTGIALPAGIALVVGVLGLDLVASPGGALVSAGVLVSVLVGAQVGPFRAVEAAAARDAAGGQAGQGRWLLLCVAAGFVIGALAG